MENSKDDLGLKNGGWRDGKRVVFCTKKEEGKGIGLGGGRILKPVTYIVFPEVIKRRLEVWVRRKTKLYRSAKWDLDFPKTHGWEW